VTLPSNGGTVITGATSGIGRAILLALAREGIVAHIVGRDPDALRETERAAAALGASPALHRADLSNRTETEALARELGATPDGLDVLVHSAGALTVGFVEDSSPQDLDLLLAVNLTAPYILTRALLPRLERARGQIVFVNSSQGVRAGAGNSHYAATKHALKALADSLRQEVNDRGIRVLSVYPGRTASRMQEDLCRLEGRPYAPESLLQPDDVAEAVLAALRLKRSAEVTDIHIRGMVKPPSPRRESPGRTGGRGGMS
jgi:NAD(P)-dependent dehydrogenase (short-subunit alcohol dehydrogenase family)